MRQTNPNLIEAFRLKSGEEIRLADLEAHGLSYVPCDYNSPAVERYAHLWNDRKQVTLSSYGEGPADWAVFKRMQGVQIMTGQPTFKDSVISPSGSLYLMDFDIECRIQTAYPEHYRKLIDTIYGFHVGRTPCHIRTKSGGDRFSLYVPGFAPKVSYYDKTVFEESKKQEMLFEFFSKNGLSRLDNRYSLVTGSLFEIPQFHSPEEIDPLTDAVRDILQEIGTLQQTQTATDARVVEHSHIGDLDVSWRETTITPEKGTPYKAMVSQRFPTSVCQETNHSSNRKEVSFTKFENGSIQGHCFNCGAFWWEVRPEKRKIRKKKLKKEKQTEDDAQGCATLEDADVTRAAAAETFLKETEREKTELLLLKEWTGTGKTHTILTKASEHEKRTLAQLPHTELAAQAVDTALQAGFKNPKHLLGREHNWDASGIEKIPVSDRTPALFAQNGCIRVEDVRRFREHHLSERSFCEMFCPFRDDCVESGHLSQYVGLEERDFVATANPNLLFDIRARGYLKSLVNTRHEPSDEELAIDAALGTKSEPVTAFDFAILDDYTLNSLYSDVTLSLNRIKAFKKAWEGTVAGDFAKRLCKAFEKKKPHQIVKALRKLLTHSHPHFDEIATALTQHARSGVIQLLDRQMASQESGRLLAEKQVHYDDGGTQFIPVSRAAFVELSEKSIPTLHPDLVKDKEIGDRVLIPHTPTGALKAGVPLSNLTVWHPRATPIEMIRLFLESLGNDKNAPITRHRSDENTTFTFSIPPQAPVGILPKIALISATTDTDAVKKAFDGQDVIFTEHVGKGIKWAEGVEVFQYADARLTSASVFEYETDHEGKRKLQTKPTGLTEKSTLQIRNLTEWAKETEGVTAFISYKEFTETFADAVAGFDIVTHFDKIAGLNFDGLKYLVVFGYPKVKHEAVMKQARKQYAKDTEPLPKGSYDELTETEEVTENGITSYECRYTDPRLDSIRKQLATEKLLQAIGRARLPRWEKTTTLIFTNTPIPDVTQRATLFTDAAFKLAEHPRDIPNALERIASAVKTGDVQAVMEAKGVAKSQAYKETQEARYAKKAEQDAARDSEIARILDKGLDTSLREIERLLKARGHVRVVRKYIKPLVEKIQARPNSSGQLVPLIGEWKMVAAHENPDNTWGEGQNKGDSHAKVPMCPGSCSAPKISANCAPGAGVSSGVFRANPSTICDVVDRVGVDLAQDEILTSTQKLCEWVETLRWAVKLLPEGYETSRHIILAAIKDPQVRDFDVSNKAKNAL